MQVLGALELLQFPLVFMIRLNKPDNDVLCRVTLFLKDPVFQIILSMCTCYATVHTIDRHRQVQLASGKMFDNDIQKL